MPRELIALDARKPVLRDYTDAPLKPDEVRFRSEFAAAKHGTELSIYRGEAMWMKQRYDPELKLFVEDPARKPFPAGLGNMAVGVVTEVGRVVSRFKAGDRVFCHSNFRETVTRPESNPDLRHLPDGMSWQAAVCVDPAEFAVAAVRDGMVRVGDNVAVFGLGAIGLIIAQLAQLQGARRVIVVDPIEARRKLAEKLDADLALDPAACDAGLEIKRATGNWGADVAFEVSGSYAALQQAIRGVAFGGNVVAVAAYKECKGGLDLGMEWHFNRPNLISARANSDPNREHPRWDWHRCIETAFELLRDGEILAEDIVTPIVPFAEVAEAYQEFVDCHPERSIKLGVQFEGGRIP